MRLWRLTLPIVLAAACGPADRENEADGLALADPEFELVLALPGPYEDEPVFHHITGIEPTSDGSEIVVVDRWRPSIRIFDWEGRLLREFGTREHGFGELEIQGRLQVADELLIVGDLADRTLNVYRLDGTHESTRISEGHTTEDGSSPQRHEARALVRFDQVISYFQPSDTTRAAVLIDSRDRRVATLAEYPTGRARIRLRRNPAGTAPTRAVPSGGAGAVFGVAGDSMVVVVEAYRGVVEWRRIEEGGTTTVARRELDWAPEPFELDPAQAKEEEAEARGIDPSEVVELRLPRFHAQVRALFPPVAPNGDVWLERRTWRERGTRPSPFTEHRILVPFDKTEPVREFLLPANFTPRALRDDLAFGVHEDPVSGEQSVHVYRVTF